MEAKAVVKACKDLGCCDACCLRYLGLKNPNAFENPREFVNKYLEYKEDTEHGAKEQGSHANLSSQTSSAAVEEEAEIPANIAAQDDAKLPPTKATQEDAELSTNRAAEEISTKRTEKEEEEVPAKSPAEVPTKRAAEKDDEVLAKRVKTEDVCVSCLGVLQEENWPPCLRMLREVMDKKQYECETFACALSAPTATILRERAVGLCLAQTASAYPGAGGVTPLKEAWKWAAGGALAAHCGKALHSGAVAPLLVTLHLDYPHEAAELGALRALAGGAGAPGSLTRRQAERALDAASAGELRAAGLLPPPRPAARAAPVSVTATHEPLYLAGRYVKLSRALPQTPWVLRGERVMDSSVQEIIFEPLARLFGMEPAEAQQRLKFIAAGREDVDVRCLGTGRPFAVEVADPAREPSAAELARACAELGAGGAVRVARLQPVARARLAELKRGEETRSKTYEALCIKLRGAVSAADVRRAARWAARLEQRTPLRVLHRRPLLARRRALAALGAAAVPAHPRLLALRLRADAGTYVKEWAHGDLRRTRPSLQDALGAPADILALDVTEVHLAWP